MLESIHTPEYLLERARSGDTEAFGQLLTQYHNYLRLMARALVGTTLKLRLDSSDLVQEAFLEAHRDFPQFCRLDRGRAAGVAAADPGAQPGRRRPATRRPGCVTIGASSRWNRCSNSRAFRFRRPSPPPRRPRAPWRPGASGPCCWPTRSKALPADYREVVILRNLEGLKFSEVATRMGRSSGAVRMLWARAIERLSEALEGLV